MNKKQALLIVVIIIEVLVVGFLYSQYMSGNSLEEVNNNLKSLFSDSSTLELSKEDLKEHTVSEDNKPDYPIRFYKKSGNPNLSKELRPNSTQYFDGNEVEIPTSIISINSDGFRDQEYSVEKPNNTFRIIALGDSETFGRGINISDVWTEILEEKLNRKSKDKKYQVPNFGVPGYDTSMEVEMLEEKGLKYNPDMVILQYLGNDAQNQSRLEDLRHKYLKELEGSNLSHRNRVLVAWRKAAEKERSERKEKPIKRVMSKNKKALNLLNDLSKKWNFYVLIFNVMSPDDQAKYLRKICKKKGFDFLNLESLIKEYPPDKKYIDNKDSHLTGFMHKKIAEKIFDRKFYR